MRDLDADGILVPDLDGDLAGKVVNVETRPFLNVDGLIRRRGGHQGEQGGGYHCQSISVVRAVARRSKSIFFRRASTRCVVRYVLPGSSATARCASAIARSMIVRFCSRI